MSILSTLTGALEGAPNANPSGTPALNPGTAAMGGLVVSQIVTLYLTPVVYTYMAALLKTRRIPATAATKTVTA